MDHFEVIAALSSWAAWSRSDTDTLGYKPAAGSAEGRYLAAAGDVLENDRKPHEVVISDDQGLRIERAVLGCGRVHAAMLALIFVRRLPASVAIRQLRVPGDPRLIFGAALRQVGDRLA